jgi:hypothetical protein
VTISRWELQGFETSVIRAIRMIYVVIAFDRETICKSFPRREMVRPATPVHATGSQDPKRY